MKLKEISTDSHRNGICGMPFSVTLFEKKEDGATQNMVGIRFFDDSNCYTAVLDVDLLSEGDIEFGSNSWRGDRFDTFLKECDEKRSTK